MTNFEKYKAELTIDDMLISMRNDSTDCKICAYRDYNCINLRCKDGMKIWLEMED